MAIVHLTEDFQIKFRRRNFKYVCIDVVRVTLILSSLFWSCRTEDEMVCQHGIKSFAGVTYPPGDIILTQGDTLDVLCSVNLTHPKAVGYNASNLLFKVGRHKIPEHLIQRTVINETTIRMQVDNVNSSIIYLDCIIQKENGSSVPVCQNHVEVGLQPIKPTDFNCIAWNWTKLVCSWTRPFNTVKTHYSVSFITHIRKQRYENSCQQIVDHKNETFSCEWYRGDPPYRANEKVYLMKLNGTNALNKSGVVWNYSYNHFAIVVPQPPTIERFIALSSSELLVNYTFKNFEYFPPGLEHEIMVCSQENVCDINTLTTNPPAFFVEHEIKVPYAFASYRVTIRMRSQTANKTDELFWSAPVSAYTSTLPKIPDSPPTTDVGSFEIYHDNSDQRDIYIYWQDISPYIKNGPNFHYEAILYEDGHKMGILPKQTNRSYTKFVNLEDRSSYTVYIYSVNDVGRSLENTTIVIPASQKVVCNADKNVTAKVQAISLAEDNEELFKEWSQNVYVSCGESGSWITWTTMSVVLIFVLVALAFGTIKCWSCCKEMNNFEVKLPPGLQNELNSFSQPKRGGKRKNSIEDVQTYGKETMITYPLNPLKYTPSNNVDGGPGILPSTKNNKEAEDCLIDAVDTRTPQSALNPLLAAATTDDEDTLQPERNRTAEPYTKLGKFSTENSVLPEDQNSRTESVGPVATNHATNTKNGAHVEDGYSSPSPGSSTSTLSPSSPEKLSTTTDSRPDLLPTTNNAAYVRWNQLIPEIKNDTITTRQSSPYCQVGPIGMKSS